MLRWKKRALVCLPHLPGRRNVAIVTFEYLSLSSAFMAERSGGPSLATGTIPDQSNDSPLDVGRLWPSPIPLPEARDSEILYCSELINISELANTVPCRSLDVCR